MTRWLPLALALIAAPPLLAQECGDLATQTDMNICAGHAYEAADADLNRLYKQVSARLTDDSPGKKTLVTAQRAWIKYRDAECDFRASSVEGGSIQPMIQALCLETLTRARIADFEEMLTCAEGDLSCPLPPA